MIDGMKRLIKKWQERARMLKGEAFALYLAYRHPRTPWYAKAFAGLVAAYAFSPIDLIPDFIPVLGYLDDLILVPLGISIALKLIPADIMAECRETAKAKLADGKPTNWALAVLIIGIWAGLVALGIALLFKIHR